MTDKFVTSWRSCKYRHTMSHKIADNPTSDSSHIKCKLVSGYVRFMIINVRSGMAPVAGNDGYASSITREEPHLTSFER